jgi:predicted DNA-binding protein YlxM (UPF0122 family)
MQKNKRLETNLETNICADYIDGLPIKTICEKYKVSRATINNVRLRYGIERRKVLITEDLKRKVAEHYKKHLSIVKTAKAFNLNRDTASRILNDLGLCDFWHQYEQRRLVNSNPFSKLNTDECFYFLGLLATDGCIHESGHVSLGLTDRDLIVKFCEFLKADLSIYEYIDPRYNNVKPMYSIKFCNRGIVDYLSNLGLTPRKTHTLKVDFDINYSFLRGVIDGDGCITKDTDKSISVCIATASSEFKNQLVSFLEKDGFVVSVYKSDKLYNIRVGKKDQVLRLYGLLYNGANVYLERKRVVYDCIR